MAKSLLPDDLWAVVAPLSPPEPPKPTGGRPRVPVSAALTGILVVLNSGIPWGLLPQELGCGSGVTSWRRLRDRKAAGVSDRLHRTLLDRLGEADRIDWSRAALDSAGVPTKRGPDGGTEPHRSRQGRHEAPGRGRPERRPPRAEAGLSDRDIAERLFVSKDTVHTHMVNVLGKLGVESRMQAVIFALKSGLVTLE